MDEKTIDLLPEQAPPHAPEMGSKVWWDLDSLDFDHEPGEPTPQFTENVRRCGILVPILVRYSPQGGRPRVLDGVRRCKAARAAGLKAISVIGAPALDDDVVTLIANNNRSPNPRTELAAIERLIETTGATPKALARELGIPYGTVKRRMKLRKLAPSVRRAFLSGDIAVGVAESMSRLPTKEQGRIHSAAKKADVPVTGDVVGQALQVREKKAVADMPAEMFNGPTREDLEPDKTIPAPNDMLRVRRADLEAVLEVLEKLDRGHHHDKLVATLQGVLDG